jgi:hypothetical protein
MPPRQWGKDPTVPGRAMTIRTSRG